MEPAYLYQMTIIELTQLHVKKAFTYHKIIQNVLNVKYNVLIVLEHQIIALNVKEKIDRDLVNNVNV